MTGKDEKDSGTIYPQIRELLAEIGKLAKFMAEKTLRAEEITLRDKLREEKAHYQELAKSKTLFLRQKAAEGIKNTARHAKDAPVDSIITAFAAGWLVSRIFKLMARRG